MRVRQTERCLGTNRQKFSLRRFGEASQQGTGSLAIYARGNSVLISPSFGTAKNTI
ncbi:hypothetical protein LOC67_01675 [Stieleria sp. JC731]|uniref:hypothetical protein n=1 Tax=Pirellulaceae TaxID=2691357 RepID=UPI001E62644F|nr:hypothetical protein [Stieleria sp. JC731]MCC9599252.1 hypothetical protein [Stieleria sp. JC731]